MGGVFSKSTNRKVGTYLHNDENHQQSKAPDANVLIISGQKMDENSICGRDDNLDDHEVDLSTAISYSRHLRRDSETNSSILVLHDENADSNNMFLAEENVSLLPEITSDDIITSSNDSSVREKQSSEQGCQTETLELNSEQKEFMSILSNRYQEVEIKERNARSESYRNRKALEDERAKNEELTLKLNEAEEKISNMRDELVTIRKQLLVQPISLVDEAPANKLPVLLAKKPPMYPVPSPSPTQPSTTTLASSNYSESNNNSINTTVAALDDEEKKRLEKKIMKLKNLLGRERMQNAVKVFELEQHIKELKYEPVRRLGTAPERISSFRKLGIVSSGLEFDTTTNTTSTFPIGQEVKSMSALTTTNSSTSCSASARALIASSPSLSRHRATMNSQQHREEDDENNNSKSESNMSQAAANIKTSELELQIKSRNQIIMDLSMRLSELSERMESKPSEAGGGGDGGASTAASLLAALEKHSIKKGEEPAAAGQLNVVA